MDPSTPQRPMSATVNWAGPTDTDPAGWAIRSATDRVLEPSCGEAAFLLAAAARLGTFGAADRSGQLVGVEVHADSAATAERLVAAAGHSASVQVGDFFDLPVQRTFEAVIGNPPFVRYQDFTGASRAAGRRAALSGGVGLSGLAISDRPHSGSCTNPRHRPGPDLRSVGSLRSSGRG